MLFLPLMAAAWTETFDLYVVDKLHRPIPNATVKVTYQYNTVVGKRTLTFHTDERGHVYIMITNVEQTGLSDPTIVVKSCKHLSCNTTITRVGRIRGRMYQTLSIYHIEFLIKNGNQAAVPGMEINVDDEMATTNDRGRALLYLSPGTHDVIIQYGGGTVTKTINVQNDSLFVFTIPLYNVVINTINDVGEPMATKIMIGNRTFTSNGSLVIHNYPGEYIKVQAQYGMVIKTVEANLSLQQEITIVFDQTPPQIMSINATRSTDQITITLKAQDPEIYASGINPEGVEAVYVINGDEYHAKGHQAGKNTYVITLQNVPNTATLVVDISVEDMDGNIARSRVQISPYSIPQDQNQPQHGPSSNTPWWSNMWIWVAVALLVVGIIVLKGAS